MLICLASLPCPQEREHQRPSQLAAATFTILGNYSDGTGPRHRLNANHHFHCIQYVFAILLPLALHPGVVVLMVCTLRLVGFLLPLTSAYVLVATVSVSRG